MCQIYNFATHSKIYRVANPSEIYVIPQSYVAANIPEKLRRFLELHSQIRHLKKCTFVEEDKTYVVRQRNGDVRACVVSHSDCVFLILPNSLPN